jgi:hypothetical protein
VAVALVGSPAPAAPPKRSPVSTASPPVAPAPPSDEPKSLSDLLTGEAKTHYDIARILYRDGDHAGALSKFRRAYELSHDVRLLWNMAACEKNLRHYVKVLALVEQYVKDGQLDAPDLARALTFATAVRSLVGELTLRADEADASISVDDEAVGRTPFTQPILVDMGRRRVRAAKGGFRPFERTIDVEGGSTLDLPLVLEREVGRLVVRARATDAIRVDDRVVGQGTWSGLLPVGSHAVVVSTPNGNSRRTDVVLVDRESRELTVEIDSGGAIPKWLWWVGGGVLVAGAAVGGYFLFRPSGTEAPPTGTLGAYQVP